MKKCKVCNCSSESDFCFRHKERKPFPKISSFKSRNTIPTKDEIQKNINDLYTRNLFFASIWDKRKHNCENCEKWLGDEPFSYMFDHLLEKSKYPKLKYEQDNICILCLECHDNKTRGFISDILKNKIKIVREKFGI